MRSLRLSPVLVALLVTACATPAKQAALPSPADVAPQRAFLWEVTRPGAPDKPLFLTGSVHLGRPGQFIFPPSMEAALARSQSLVVELDPDKVPMSQLQQQIMHLGFLTPPDNLSAHLSAETRALLPQALERAKLSPVVAQRMRPWLLSLMLGTTEMQQSGYSGAGGIDHLLLTRARGRMTIVELETPEGQLRALSGCSEELQDLMLREQFQTTSRTVDGLDRISTAWQEGDPETLVRVLFEKRDDPVYRPYYEALFFTRNRTMADRLIALLDTPETHFVVVGAGHLVGEEGLLDLLSRRGLQVRQLPRGP